MTRTIDRSQFPKRKLTRADASVPIPAHADAHTGLSDQNHQRVCFGRAQQLTSSRVQRSGDLITAIAYPNGDKFNFTFDEQGRLQKIEANTTYVRMGTKWYHRKRGGSLHEMQYHNHALLENGDFLMHTGENRFHGRRPDGTEFDRRLTAAGAWTQTDNCGRVEVIARSNGTSVFAKYNESGSVQAIEEVSTEQEQNCLWTRERDDFVCRELPRRHKIELASNGNLSFIQKSQRIIITGDGIPLSEPTTKNRYRFDEEGRIVQIDYGTKIRQFGYINKTRELCSVSVLDTAANSTFFHERLGDCNEWSVRDHHGNLYTPWYGTRHLTAAGDYVYQECQAAAGEHSRGIAHVCRPDGTELKVEAGFDSYPRVV